MSDKSVLASVLIEHYIIDVAAIEDAENYDGGWLLSQVKKASDELGVDRQRAEIAVLNATVEQFRKLNNFVEQQILAFESLLAMKDASLRARKIAIVGGCECGIGYIDPPDSIDSGATFRCEAGHPIVFDVMTPEHRAARIGDGVTVERKMKKARDEKVPQ